MFLEFPAKGEGAFSHFEVPPSAVEICFVNIQVFLLTGKFVFVDFYVSRQWKRLSGEGNMCSNLGKYYFFRPQRVPMLGDIAFVVGKFSQCWERLQLLSEGFPHLGKDCCRCWGDFPMLGGTGFFAGTISQHWDLFSLQRAPYFSWGNVPPLP